MTPASPQVRCLVAPGFQAPMGPCLLGLQDHLYAEDELAALWLSMEADHGYAAAWDDLPLVSAAEAIAGRWPGAGPVDVIAFGPGSARQEVALVTALLERRHTPGLRLYLIDLAQRAVSAAHRHATEAFALHPAVFPLGIQGDMRRLADYGQILHRPANGPQRPRLVTLIGGTFGNLEDELAFAQDLCAALAPGDLFLFDVCLHPGRVEDDARLQTPWMTAASSPPLWAWMQAALRRRLGAELARLEARYQPATCIPGSYAVEYVGHAADGQEVRLTRLGRYDLVRLVRSLGDAGWAPVTQLIFGEPYPRALCLFQQGGQP